MEKITKYKNLIRIVHELYCDNCNIEMQDSGVVLTTFPVKYVYVCPKCQNKYFASVLYPWEEIQGEEIDG